MTRRMDRVNVLLREEISRQLATELKDPRISSMVSVTRVDTSPDLGLAKVYVSVLGDQTAKSSTLVALKSASGFIHRSMRDHIALRKVPSVDFYLDESIEQGAKVLKLISDAAPDSDPSWSS